jgi:hypothetical protein
MKLEADTGLFILGFIILWLFLMFIVDYLLYPVDCFLRGVDWIIKKIRGEK